MPGTTLQLLPSQCSISVCGLRLLPCSPTAFTGRFLKRARKQEKKKGRVGRHLASDTMNYLEVLSIWEGKDVFTRRIIAVGADRVKVSTALKSSASRRAGVVELWYGFSQILWDQQRRGSTGR